MDKIWYHGMLCAVLFPTVIAILSACSEKDRTMSKIPETVFHEPELRQAAEMVLTRKPNAAVNWAQRSKVGINTVGPEGDTLLLLAVENNDLRMVEALLTANADPNLPAEIAPLAVAAEKADIEVIQALLNANANPNGAANSESALFRAASLNRFECVKLLVKYGADLDKGNFRGDTPLIDSALGDRFPMALLLLDLGASPFIASDEGFTAGFWITESMISETSKEGKARTLLVERLKTAGFPWPPPSRQEVLAAKKRNEWPPVRN